MKKIVLMLFLFIFFCGALLFACTNNEEDSEPGAIESFTKETADEITSSIKKPLNKARAVKNTGQDRMKNVDDMVKE